MPARTAARLAIVVAAPILFLLLGIRGALPTEAAPGKPNGATVYAQLKAAADAGNPAAQRAVSEVDAFVARTGIDVASAAQVTGEEMRGGRKFITEGMPPLFLNLSPAEGLDSRASTNAYRALRHAELAAAAKSDPAREITVSITAAGHRAIPEVLEALTRNGLRPVTLMIDVFEDGPNGRVWKSRFTHAAPDDVPDAFLAAPSKDVVASVAAVLAQAHADEGDYDLSKLSFEVYLVRAVGPASGADQLTSESVILLVDSETAVADAYRNSAAHVRVILMPWVPDEVRWEAGR